MQRSSCSPPVRVVHCRAIALRRSMRRRQRNGSKRARSIHQRSGNTCRRTAIRHKSWPVERWGLTELTLLAFHDHPDLEVARAQAKAARAEGAAATQRPPLAITPRVEHHSLRTAEQSSPWSLGFEIQIPLSVASTGEAIRNRYDALARAADLRIGAAAWDVRARVRVPVARRLRQRLGSRASAERSARAGSDAELCSSSAWKPARSPRSKSIARASLRPTRAAACRSRASAGARDLAALAEALSLPLPLVRSMQLDYAELQRTAPALQDLEMRRAALLNRLDIRGKLLEYAATEADVRLEIARQYPTIAISPGFLWDQGDSIWSLAATLIPAVAGNRPAIAAAQARREVEASQFRALQDKVIVQAQGAEAAYESLAQALAQAEQMNALHLNRVQQVERQLRSRRCGSRGVDGSAAGDAHCAARRVRAAHRSAARARRLGRCVADSARPAARCRSLRGQRRTPPPASHTNEDSRQCRHHFGDGSLDRCSAVGGDLLRAR